MFVSDLCLEAEASLQIDCTHMRPYARGFAHCLATSNAQDSRLMHGVDLDNGAHEQRSTFISVSLMTKRFADALTYEGAESVVEDSVLC